MEGEKEVQSQSSLEFELIIKDLSNLKKNLNDIQNRIKTYEKNNAKEKRQLLKQVNKNKQKGNRRPSGFAKPSKVTDELCEFMGKDKGSEIARTEVTKYLINYIKNNNLQYEGNHKIIIPDDNLKTLLSIKDGTEVNYFNLQGLMNKHFVKKTNTLSHEK